VGARRALLLWCALRIRVRRHSTVKYEEELIHSDKEPRSYARACYRVRALRPLGARRALISRRALLVRLRSITTVKYEEESSHSDKEPRSYGRN
jgi:hypothetical protein